MAKQSAGIILFRKLRDNEQILEQGLEQVLLVHPGGPFWAKKDEGSWSIPKGLYDNGEEPLAAAKRELKEETGISQIGELFELGAFKQPSGKTILAWAAESDFDPADLQSNTFSMEWPPKSGRQMDFPEVDRAAWFSMFDALRKITKGQRPIIAALAAKLGVPVILEETRA